MKLFLSLIFSILLVTTLASPLQKRSAEDETSPSFFESIKKIKSNEYYGSLATQIDSYVEQADVALAMLEVLDEEHESTDQLASTQAIIKATKVLLEMLNATVPEGAQATEKQMTEFAKNFSGLLRGSDFKFHALRTEKQELENAFVMNNGTVTLLKNLLVNHPMVAIGGNNEILEILKQQQPAAYEIIKKMQQWTSKRGEWFQNPTAKHFVDIADEVFPGGIQEFAKFMAEYYMVDFFREQRSEENAIEFFKDFGVLVSALKDPASYDSFEALYRNLARSNYWESIALFIKNTAKCFAQPLSDDDKQELMAILQNQLKYLMPVFADGQESSARESHIDLHFKNWKSMDGARLRNGLKKAGFLDDAPVSDTVKKCLYSDEDKAIYKEIIASGLSTVSDEKLEELKKRSEIAYSIVALLNRKVKRIHRREGLSEPAMTFVKKLSTVPNSLLSMAPGVSPGQETLEKVKEAKLSLVREFNSLSAAVKMELVDEFPHQVLLTFASLE